MALSELSKLQVIQKRQELAAEKLIPEPEKAPMKKKKESIFAPDEAEAVSDEST